MDIFDAAKVDQPEYSSFDLSYNQKLSCNMGKLIPTFFEEIVPGDEYMVNSQIAMRLAPLISPVMHEMNVFMHYFFVPNRLIWNQWEDFIAGGQKTETEPVMPKVKMEFMNHEGDLADYLGLPKANDYDGKNFSISVLPFRAYQMIWNEYYRDETLQPEIENFDDISAEESAKLRRRCWEKDYFTSALPWTQRGKQAAVDFDLQYKNETHVDIAQGSVNTGDGPLKTDSQGRVLAADSLGSMFPARIENIDSKSFKMKVRELRQSSAIQRWLEQQARSGYRYIETILSHFGVESSDERLQRPEYLGGSKQPIQVSEVLNTADTQQGHVGEMSGHGISVGQTPGFQKKFEEHGFVFGIMSVLPRTAYQQGINKLWLRDDKFDYYWPAFANLGEQPVKNMELYYDEGDMNYNKANFGYQQRYAEYKYNQDSVHGDFRDSLNFWHMGRIFNNQPALNAEFVKADPDDRIFAVPDSDNLWTQIHHNVKARRPMPYFSEPRLK